jgi:hypothetical protein
LNQIVLIKLCGKLPATNSDRAVNAARFKVRHMKRLLLITLLVLNSGPVYAEWVLTSGNDDAGLTVYVDPETIRRKGNLVKMWQLYDYKTIQTVAGDSLLSIKRYNEYDCTEERTRMLAYTWFSGNMGSGKVVYSTPDEQQWEPVIPRSINRTLWNVACSKK